jgi:hypothetical protein
MNLFILSFMLFKNQQTILNFLYAYKTLPLLPVHIRTFFIHSQALPNHLHRFRYSSIHLLLTKKISDAVFHSKIVKHLSIYPFILFCISCHFWFLLYVTQNVSFNPHSLFLSELAFIKNINYLEHRKENWFLTN